MESFEIDTKNYFYSSKITCFFVVSGLRLVLFGSPVVEALPAGGFEIGLFLIETQENAHAISNIFSSQFKY